VTAAPAVVAVTPRRTGRLYRDAAALASSSMLTAVLGFGFWAICARFVAPATLGVQTALMSIITAPAIVIASGMGDAFTALVPIAGRDAPALVRRGYRRLLVTASALGLGAGTLAVTVLPEVRGSLSVAALVAVGVVIWCLFVVQDPALTSLGRARWLPIENGSVSLVKIGLLPLALAVGVAQPVVVASLLPCVAAIAVLRPQVSRLAAGHEGRSATVDAVAELPRLALRTTVSIAMSLGVLTATPFLVTAAAGPERGAVFSLALAIVQSLDFVGAALGVSLVVHASGKDADGARMARIVLARAAAIVGGGAVVLVLLSPFALRLLDGRYLQLHGVVVIALLALGSAGRCGYVIWAALQRARRQMRALLTLNAVVASAVLAAIVPIASRWGAVGAAALVAGANLFLTLCAGIHVAARHHARRRR